MEAEAAEALGEVEGAIWASMSAAAAALSVALSATVMEEEEEEVKESEVAQDAEANERLEGPEASERLEAAAEEEEEEEEERSVLSAACPVAFAPIDVLDGASVQRPPESMLPTTLTRAPSPLPPAMLWPLPLPVMLLASSCRVANCSYCKGEASPADGDQEVANGEAHCTRGRLAASEMASAVIAAVPRSTPQTAIRIVHGERGGGSNWVKWRMAACTRRSCAGVSATGPGEPCGEVMLADLFSWMSRWLVACVPWLLCYTTVNVNNLLVTRPRHCES